MKSAAFAYQRPSSVQDAVRVFSQTEGAAKPLGGGQSLGPMLNLRLVRAQLLVDVSGLEEIRAAAQKSDGLWIGGATTHAEIEDGKLDPLLPQPSPLAQMLRYVAGTIAYRAVRNRGTVAGSLAHADPAADWVLTMTVLDAQLQCASAQGQRAIPMSQFMLGAFTTALNSGELVTGVTVPPYSKSMRWGYYKFCRKTGEFAEASCACVFDPERGIARIAIGALDGAPAFLQKLAADIARRGLDALTDAAVLEAVAAATPGKDDIDRRLVVAAVKRSVKQAWGAA
jgi:carbon-monoxide dehydrogenase medium subunit